MIPAFTVLSIGCLHFLHDYYEVYLFVIFIVCAYFITVLHRRTVKIGTKWAIILIASVIIGVILSAFNIH